MSTDAHQTANVAPVRGIEQLRQAVDAIANSKAGAWLLVDNLKIEPVGPEHRRLMRSRAIISIAIVFLIGFGTSTCLAIAVLCGYKAPDKTFDSSSGSIFAQLAAPYAIGFEVVVCIGTVILIRYFLGRPPLLPTAAPTRRPAVFSGLITIPIGMLVIYAAMLARGALSAALHWEEKDFPYTELRGTPSLVLGGVDLSLAGPSEELALVALVVVALRRGMVKWRYVYLAAAVLRIPFHLYYGWGAVALFFWPVVFVYLYRRTGAIWGLVVAHSLWNTGVFLEEYKIVADGTWALFRVAALVACTAFALRLAIPSVRESLKSLKERRWGASRRGASAPEQQADASEAAVQVDRAGQRPSSSG